MGLHDIRVHKCGKCGPIAVAICAGAAICNAATGFSAVLGGAGQEYVSAVAADRAGNSYVAGVTFSPDFPVTPGAVQTTFGGTSDAFVAKLGPDGKVLWSTFLGGILDDGATGIALDAAGNVLVSGWTRSQNFPLAHAIQGVLNHGATSTSFDAFVAKIDPSGRTLLYSTFLGGPDHDWAYGLATDAAGNAYVAGGVQTASGFPGFAASASGFGIFVTKLDAQGGLVYSFFHPTGTATAIAVDSAGSAYVAGMTSGNAAQTLGLLESQQGVVFKLSADGSRQVYEMTLGGPGGSQALAIAVDRTGSAYVGGITASIDFPLIKPLQSRLGAMPLWKSTDGGATWTPLEDLPFADPQTAMVDPSAPGTLYVATGDVGMVKSTAGGATWTKMNRGIADTNIKALAIDPRHPLTLYAGTGSTPGRVYKTVDGGNTWTVVDSPASGTVSQLAVDAQNPQNVYAVWASVAARRSTDGGATWSDVAFPGNSIASLAADPAASGTVYAFSNFVFGGGMGTSISPYLWYSTDAGATWTRVSSPAPFLNGGMLIDASVKPSIVYNGIASRSDDGGATWIPLTSPKSTATDTTAIALDDRGTLYAAVSNDTIYVSHDRGATWTAIGSPPPFVTAIVPTGDPAILYTALRNRQTTGFVAKLAPDGSGLLFSTFLGGHVSFSPQVQYLAEPEGVTWQSGISALAIDREGNVVVAGASRAADFPLVDGASACRNGGAADAFVATLAADGSRLTGLACVGGSQDDGVLAMAARPGGGVIVAGQTWSPDFPVSAGLPRFVGFGDAFVESLGGAVPSRMPRLPAR